MQTKMQTKLTSTVVDITKFPRIDTDSSMTDNTIGDLHANPLLLLNALVTKGIVQISPEDYQAFVVLYTLAELQSPKDEYGQRLPAPIFSKPDKKERLGKIYSDYNEIIKSIKVIDKKTLFRIIGDDGVDRGVCDALMLALMELLDEKGANFEILASNHGMELVDACENFEKNGNKLVAPRMGNHDHGNSMVALQLSIEAGAIDAQQIVDIYNNSYKKHLKIVSYSLNAAANEIYIFSHAGIGLNHIRGLAKKFDVPYSAMDAADLAKTIDNINEQFASKVKANQVHTLYSHDVMMRGYGLGAINGKPLPINDHKEVIEAVVWNRDYTGLDRESDNFTVVFIHGHDSSDQNNPKHVTLNEGLGQFTNYVGTLKVYATNGKQSAPVNKLDNVDLKEQSRQAPQKLEVRKSPGSSKFHSDESDSEFDVTTIPDLAESGLNHSALDVPLFELSNSPLGKRPFGWNTPNLSDDPFGLNTSSLGDDPFGLNTSSLGDDPLGLNTSSLGDDPSGLNTSSLGDDPSGLNTSSLGDDPFGLNTSSLGDTPTDLNNSQFFLDNFQVFDLNESSLGLNTSDLGEPVFVNLGTSDETPSDDLGDPDSLDMDELTLQNSRIYDLGRFPKSNSGSKSKIDMSQSTLGDAPIYAEEIEPSFLFACCSNFTGAEIIGYSLVIGLLAVAIAAICVASYGLAGAMVAAAVPLACGLGFFNSKKSKEDFNDPEQPRDRIAFAN